MVGEHMIDNLDPKVAATKLDAADLKVLESFPPDKCSKTNNWVSTATVPAIVWPQLEEGGDLYSR